MSDLAMHPLEEVLRSCAAAAPDPWYPFDHAKAKGVTRDSLDDPLNRLRMGGLIQLTDWVKDHGQGYVLTPEGARLLENRRDLEQLKSGRLPPRRLEETPHDVGPATPWDRGEEVRDVFLQPRVAVVSYVLFAINVLVFVSGMVLAQLNHVPIGQYLSGGADNPNDDRVWEIQRATGAISGLDIARGQWWRLLACCFVHLGWIHLAVNMYTLYAVGPMLENMWGRWRYLLIYLLAGVVGSCAMVYMTPKVRGAGASGALWGIIASMAVWILLNRQYLPGALASSLLRNLGIVFLINVYISTQPGISAAAHFGGGGAGAILGVLVHYQRFGPSSLRWLAGLGIALVPVIAIGAVRAQMDTNPAWSPMHEWVEADGFLDAYGAQVSQPMNAMLTVFQDQARPLAMLPPADPRDPAAVKQVRAALAESRSQLQNAIASVEKSGPFQGQNANVIRLGCLEYLRDGVELAELAEEAVQGGKATRDSKREMLQQERKVLELRKRLAKRWPSFLP
ncbi:MAG: rhomboid family intramembrane serine protease [Gemmataceae bacterium]|nr:rhomboid family intramembrane serine protease [Gemmataceae bacterium]